MHPGELVLPVAHGRHRKEGGLKTWVTSFLRSKGDPNISIEELEREVNVPKFCWRRLTRCFLNNFRDNTERLQEVIGSVLGDLEQNVFVELLSMPLLFVEFTKIAMVQRLPIFPDYSYVLPIMFGDIRDFSFMEARGIVAHEFCHVLLGHYQDRNPSHVRFELDADAKARELNFSDEISSIRNYFAAKGEI